MPDQLVSQLPLIKRLLAAYRVPVYEREGFEAEDVLGTMAGQLVGEGAEVYLVTGDKDLLQLVNSHIKVYNPHQKEDGILDAAAVEARYGIGPDRMVDLLALMGDATDNIPSVPGIGEKTAVQLLQQFGSLEALYGRLAELQPGRREALQSARQQVEVSRELARIDTHVPLQVTLAELAPQPPDAKELRTLFRELEFRQLLGELADEAAAVATGTAAVELLEGGAGLERLLDALRDVRTASVCCWALGAPGEGLLCAVALSGESARVIRMTPEQLTSAAGRAFAEWLANTAMSKLSHDAKAMKRLLRSAGLEVNGLCGDTMLAAHLLNPARNAQSLTDLSDEHLGEPLPALPEIEEPGLLPSTAEAVRPFGQYACAVLRLHDALLPKLQESGLRELYLQLELPLLDVLARMEAAGIAVDLKHLAGLQATYQAELDRLAREIFELAGAEFNINSPKQLAQVLFERLKLPVIKRTKTGPSTDSEVLQRLAEQHPLPRQLMQYRELSKLVSTYLDALPKLVNPATGRLHTSFNQTATATGRLSSSEPNLQNIPIKTDIGRSIRRAFIAGLPNGALLAADYSQVELRILAHLSGDEQLRAAFLEGHDIHRFTASLIYGLPEAEVQPEQRSAMKAVNFGILYGMSAHGLSKELGMGFEEAQAFIDAYFDRYPKVRAYLESQIAQARRDGYVQTLLGRRRYIPEVNHPDGVIRQLGERMAINAPVQGTAADIIKRAMVQIDLELSRQRLRSRMLLQVHDELVFEAPREELPQLAALVKRTMEGALALDVPLTVTLKAGPNWLDLSPLGG
jgi:DNA polymerase-1